MRNKAEVSKAFEAVAKLSPGQSACLQKVTFALKDAALEVMELVPESRYRVLGLEKLLDAKRTLIQAITHGVTPEQVVEKGIHLDETIEIQSRYKEQEETIRNFASENVALKKQNEALKKAFEVQEHDIEILKTEIGRLEGAKKDS